MRKKSGLVLLIICVILFVVVRLIPLKKTGHQERFKEKPLVPHPLLNHPLDRISHTFSGNSHTLPTDLAPQTGEAVLQEHDPHLSEEQSQSPEVRFSTRMCEKCGLAQNGITGVNLEMVRDLSALHTFCHEYGCPPSFLMEALQELQKGIPFEFPAELYNVLYIVEFPHHSPYPFHVHKRLYLGESEFGFPFYLDVRVFEKGEENREAIIGWHQRQIDGPSEMYINSEEEVSFISEGNPTEERGHGFGEGARGVFVDAKLHEGKLFVLYAEAPLSTFKQHVPLFKQLTNR